MPFLRKYLMVDPFFYQFLNKGVKKRIRIKDIAERAQVSRGTVDRVIHNRGNVSSKIQQKVLAVLEELNYEKNILASTLAYNRTFHIGVLLPNYQDDPFWEQPKKGIEKALRAVEHYGVKVSYFYFDQYKTESFNEQAQLLLEQQIDSVLFAPNFFNEANVFMEKCEAKQFPYVQINSYSGFKGTFNLGYIGQDSYQSGVLAARLLSYHLQAGDKVAILHMEKSIENAHHLIEKEKGFRDFFTSSTLQDIEIVQLVFPPDQEPELMNAFFSEHLLGIRNLAAVLVSTSRAYMLAEFLHLNAKGVHLGGFDLIEKNTNFLLEGKIDFLLNQNPLKQGYYGIMRLAEFFLKKSTNDATMNVQLDIVVKENLKYYLQATKELQVIV